VRVAAARRLVDQARRVETSARRRKVAAPPPIVGAGHTGPTEPRAADPAGDGDSGLALRWLASNLRWSLTLQRLRDRARTTTPDPGPRVPTIEPSAR
jgi:hypothetical protein